MKWYELSVDVIAGNSDDISAIFHELNTMGIEIIDVKDYDELEDGWLGTFKTTEARAKYDPIPNVKGYFKIDTPIDQLIMAVINKLTAYDSKYSGQQLESSIVQDSEWAEKWKEYYKPINVTQDIRIIPIWEKEDTATDGKLDIFLDPGVAFGTGSHATTQLALQLMNVAMRGGEDVIDVGTGSGILAIMAGKLGADHIAAYDYDGQAITATEYNISINDLSSKVDVAQNDKLNGIDTQVDLIVANILADILLVLIPQAYQNLHPNGSFILSGIYKDNYQEVLDGLIVGDFRIEEIVRRGDWYAIYAKKGRDDLSKDTL